MFDSLLLLAGRDTSKIWQQESAGGSIRPNENDPVISICGRFSHQGRAAVEFAPSVGILPLHAKVATLS
jgi:hypothetical protein